MFDSSTKELPAALEPEKSVLSSILRDPDPYMDRAIESGLKPEHFSVPAHQTVYAAAMEMDEGVELIGLTQLLADRGTLANCGGHAGVTELYTFAPSSGYFDHHLGIIRNKHSLRHLIAACSTAIGKAYANPDDAEALMTGLAADLEAHISEGDGGERNTKHIKDLLPTVINAIEDRIHGNSQEWLPLPWRGIRITRGGAAFVGARPGKGKSAFLLNLVEHLALVAGEPSCIISLEMSADQLAERSLNSVSRVQTTSRSEFTKGDLRDLQGAANKLGSSPYYVSEMPGATADEVVAEMRRVQRLHGVNNFAVDYIQDIGSSSKEESHRDKLRIDNALTRFDVVRKKHGMTHVFAAQTDRSADDILPRDMKMGMLCDSSKLEKIAYQIIFLGIGEKFDAEADPLEMEACVAKNRCGTTGKFNMRFHRRITKWVDA